MRNTPLQENLTGHTAIANSAYLPQKNGQPDYTDVIGHIHSHPKCLPNGTNPDGSVHYTDWYSGQTDLTILMRPSQAHQNPDGSWSGDWVTYNSIMSLIGNSRNDPNYVANDPSRFTMFIAGFDGNDLGLNEYSPTDNGTTTTKNPIDTGSLPPCPEGPPM